MTGVEPSAFAVGTDQLIVAVPELLAATVIAKPGSDAVDVPSETLITMLLYVPAAVGVPLSAPVVVLKLAQLGLFWMLKLSVAPAAALVVGVNV